MNFFKKLYATRTPSTHSLDALKPDQAREESDPPGRPSLESSPSENSLSLRYPVKTRGTENVYPSGVNLLTDFGCCAPSRRPSMCLSYAAVVHSVQKSKTEKKEKVLTIREVKLSSNKHIAEVLPGLYLGSKEAAHDLATLKQFSVTHILNVTEEVDVRHSDKLAKTLKIPLRDLPSSNIVAHFQVAFDFIDEARFGAYSGPASASPRKSLSRYKSRQGGGRLEKGPLTEQVQDVSRGKTLQTVPATGEEDNNGAAVEGSPKKSKKLTRAESTGKRCGSVLVHCYYGVSRSAAIVIGYLIERESMPLEDAVKYLRIIRPQVKPNEGFMKQLKHHEEGLLLKAK